jgi:hypothetical protein
VVEALTEDDGIEDEYERKAELRRSVYQAPREAAAVFAADKVSKVRELRIRLSCDPDFARDPAARSKLDHYRRSLAMLHDRLGEHPLVAQLQFELEMLESLPPRALAGAIR